MGRVTCPKCGQAVEGPRAPGRCAGCGTELAGEDLPGIGALLGVLRDDDGARIARARHAGWGFDVLVHTPGAARKTSPALLDAWRSGVRRWAAVPLHPNVVACYADDDGAGGPGAIVEDVPGETLATALAANALHRGDPRVVLGRVLQLAADVLRGLSALHAVGASHGDLHPGNVLLDTDGVARVTDPGLVVAGNGQGNSSRAGIAYTSPEQIASHRASPAADVWAWALLTLECFLGERPWTAGTSAPALLDAREPARRPGAPEMPAVVRALLRRCFSGDSAQRPADAGAALEAFETAAYEALGEPLARAQSRPAVAATDTLVSRAAALADHGRDAEALPLLASALEQPGDDDPRARFAHAVVSWRAGAIDDEALTARMREVEAANPRRWDLPIARAAVDLERGDVDSARAALDSAALLAGDDPVASARAVALRAQVQPRELLVQAFENEGVRPRALRITPEGTLAVAGYADGRVACWELATGRCRWITPARAGGLNDVALSADGSRVFVCSDGGRLVSLSGADGSVAREFKGHQGHVLAVDATPDGKVLFSGDSHGEVRLWDANSGGVLTALRGPRDWVSTVSVTPDARWGAASSEDGFFRVWNLDNGRCVALWEGSSRKGTSRARDDERKKTREFLDSITLTDDGRFAIVSVGAQDTLGVWDVNAGAYTRTWTAQHRQGVDSELGRLALSPDRTRAASSGADGFTRVWEVATGRCLRRLWGAQAPVALSAGSSLLLAGTRHGSYLWQLQDYPRAALPMPAPSEIRARFLADAHAARRAHDEARLRAEQERARKIAEEQAAQKQREEEAERARQAAAEEAARLAAEQERARKAAEEEAARIAAEQQRARRAAAEEAARLAAEQERARKAAEEEAARVAVAEARARELAAIEAKRLAEEARKAAEEEARLRKAAEEERARRAAEDERARKAAEEQAARRAAEEARAKRAAEEQAAREAEAARARQAAEDEARRQAEQERARVRAEAEAAQRAAEAEAAQRAAEQAAQRAAEAERIRRAEAESAQRAADEEAQRAARARAIQEEAAQRELLERAYREAREAEARRRAADEEAERRAQEERATAERARRAEEERILAEESVRRAERERVRRAEQEAARRAAEDAETRRLAALEAARRGEAEAFAARERAEELARKEAEARAARETEERARREAEAREAEERTRREAEARETEERARREAGVRAAREAEARAAEARAAREAEETARREAEARARREAEALSAQRRAEQEIARRIAAEREDAARREAEIARAAATDTTPQGVDERDIEPVLPGDVVERSRASVASVPPAVAEVMPPRATPSIAPAPVAPRVAKPSRRRGVRAAVAVGVVCGASGLALWVADGLGSSGHPAHAARHASHGRSMAAPEADTSAEPACDGPGKVAFGGHRCLEVRDLALGRGRSCVLTADGAVLCWPAYQERADGARSFAATLPEEIDGLEGVRQIVTREFHACALTERGGVSCFGRNAHGELGDGARQDRAGAAAVREITDAVSIAVGDGFSCAALRDGSVRCWGDNMHGQLGPTDVESSPRPVAVAGVAGAREVVAGEGHACVRTMDGAVYCWGRNDEGQVGTGSAHGSQREAPTRVLDDAVQVTAGALHTCALLRDRTVECWGENRQGQLGDGTGFKRGRPVAVPGVRHVERVFAGAYHTCALLADRSVRCWGSRTSYPQGGAEQRGALAPALLDGVDAVENPMPGTAVDCAWTPQRSLRCWSPPPWAERQR